jgi:hypothetical protein
LSTRKYHADAEYRLVCRDSGQKWRSRNPDYQRHYRQEHPVYVEQNWRAQKRRDSRRRVHHLVKNNLAFDPKSISADVWLVGSELENLVKNTSAISEVMNFQTVPVPEARAGLSCKEHPPVREPALGL